MSGHPGFKAILDERWELHQQKALAYGSDKDPLANIRAGERFGVPPWKRCLIEANDAFTRMENVCNGRNSDNDSIENALKDAASWCDLALLLLREEREKRESDHMERLGWIRTEAGDWIIIDDPEAKQFHSEEEIKDRQDWMVKATSLLASAGYRPPSEEVGKRMTETLEKAK